MARRFTWTRFRLRRKRKRPGEPPKEGAVMGLAVAMVLFLLAIAVVLGAVSAVVWGVVQSFRLAFMTARSVLRRGRT
jgi:hypothetical protein